MSSERQQCHCAIINELSARSSARSRAPTSLPPREAGDLKTTGKGNLFVIVGEPDIEILNEKDGKVRVKARGVEVRR